MGKFDSRATSIGTLLAIYAVVFSVVLIVRPLSDSALVVFDDLGGLPAPFLASLLLFGAFRSTSADIRHAWLYLALAFVFWGIGDSIWAAYEVVLDVEAPFPSVGDAFYLLGYGMLFLGALGFSHRERALGLRTALDAIAITLAGSAVIWQVAIEPIFEDSRSATLDKVLTGLYPAADMLVLFALCLAVYRHREGKAGTVFVVVSLGVLLVLASDVGFAYLENAGVYSTGSIIDAGWILGFLVVGFGALLQTSWRPAYASSSDDLSDSAWKQGFPLVVMIVATSWVILGSFDGRPAAIPLVAAVLLMMCVVVVRHFLTLHENIELRVELEKTLESERLRSRLDGLTGTLNRRAVIEQLEQRLSRSARTKIAIGMADIDGMKRINDSFGHQAGDDALLAVAAALSQGAQVGRYGGDEFLVILEDADTARTDSYCRGVDASLASWSDSRAGGFSLAASMGFAFAPREGALVSELVVLADRRMYEVKNQRSARTSALSPVA